MLQKFKIDKNGKIALMQIFILIIGIVAVSWALGSEVGVVSGFTVEECLNKGGQCRTTCSSSETANGYCGDTQDIICCVPQSTSSSSSTTTSSSSTSYENLWNDPNYQKGKQDGYTDALNSVIPARDYGKIPKTSLSKYEAGYADGYEEGEKFLEATKQYTQSASSVNVPTAVGTIASGTNAYQTIKGIVSGGTSAAETASTEAGTWFNPAKGQVEPIQVSGAGGTSATAKVSKFWSKWYGQTIANAAYALGIYYGVKAIGEIVGANSEKTDAVAKAAGVGYFAGRTASQIISKIGTKNAVGKIGFNIGGKFISSTMAGWGIGIGIGLYTLFKSYKDTKTERYIFECKPWQPNTGGNNCEKCNSQGILGCNEYQCKSLGQSCELINKGTSEEMCAWVNKNDVTPPEIQVWNDALTSNNYQYNPVSVSSGSRGVEIKYNSNSGCIPAFTAFSFGINTNEPAMCKIDYLRSDKFENMNYYLGGSNSLIYNHTQYLSLPPVTEENLTLGGAGEYELYVRCQDSNGNANQNDFVFKFCIDKGPDATAPLIVTTSILSDSPVSYGTQEVPLEVYTNEPANCKWSTRDQSYEQMEHQMTCSSEVEDINTALLYTCETTLPDLKKEQNNKFYFKCQDVSPQKNTNTESYEFELKGSEPLVIDYVGPNGTIKDSTQFVRVELTARTSAGFNEGEATCQYSETGESEDYIDFFETHSYQHSQDLILESGTYKYFIRCLDFAGNSDVETVSFTVESDPSAPEVVRVYHQDKNLKLITNEEAVCVYTTFGCSYNFDDATRLETSDGIEHLVYWNTKTNFYIKCKDKYDNKPLPNECNLVVRPLKI